MYQKGGEIHGSSTRKWEWVFHLFLSWSKRCEARAVKHDETLGKFYLWTRRGHSSVVSRASNWNATRPDEGGHQRNRNKQRNNGITRRQSDGWTTILIDTLPSLIGAFITHAIRHCQEMSNHPTISTYMSHLIAESIYSVVSQNCRKSFNALYGKYDYNVWI